MLQIYSRRAVLIAACVVISTAGAFAQAADSSDNTVITVGEMCGGCVKKITKKLKAMDGVASVNCDIKSKTTTVVPKDGVVFSPRTLWEAMDEIGKSPLKLKGPSGEFTSKPEK